MAGNNTLSTLLTELRDILNEPTAGFWTDSQLTRYLKRAHRKYFDLWTSLAPSRNTNESTVTYTANSRYIELSLDPPISRIVSIEDRTNATNNTAGSMLKPAESYEQILQLSYDNAELSISGTDAYPAVYWLEEFESDSSGVKTVTQRLWLAPVPGGSRTLLIRYLPAPSNFDSSSDTSGLPERVEECILLKAAIYARLQEENTQGVAALKAMLQDAEYQLLKNSRTTRGPGRIKYYSVD